MPAQRTPSSAKEKKHDKTKNICYPTTLKSRLTHNCDNSHILKACQINLTDVIQETIFFQMEENRKRWQDLACKSAGKAQSYHIKYKKKEKKGHKRLLNIYFLKVFY